MKRQISLIACNLISISSLFASVNCWSDGIVTKVQYEVSQELNVPILMRDGTRLSTDIYRPMKKGRFPIILHRTPYDNSRKRADGERFASQGFVYVTQDTRGRYDSEGQWIPFFKEANDGFDTLEWLAKQKWSNGRICTIGGSYDAWLQWFTAELGNKHLVCMVSYVAPPQPFKAFPFENGVTHSWAAKWALLMDGRTWQLFGNPVDSVFEDSTYQKLYHWSQLSQHLPVNQIDDKAGRDIPWYNEWFEHESLDPYWEKLNYEKRYNKIAVPVLHISGWYDFTFLGTPTNYEGMRKFGKDSLARSNQKMIIGPWGHWVNRSSSLGSVDFGKDAIINLDEIVMKWLNVWLRGDINDSDTTKQVDIDKVKIFIMGENKWRNEKDWPLERTKFKQYYLSSNGNASQSFEGLLKLTTIANSEQPDEWVYDPENPTPSSKTPSPALNPTGPEDLVNIQKRNDVVVYQTPPLNESIEVTGTIKTVIYASSSAPDTDFFIRLSDVHPDGFSTLLTHGVVRAKFRDSLENLELLIPEKVYRFEIDMWPTSNLFKIGHRIRVDISSAMFPLYFRNLNTGENNQTSVISRKATQKLYHGKKFPSYIRLPVIPRDHDIQDGKRETARINGP